MSDYINSGITQHKLLEAYENGLKQLNYNLLYKVKEVISTLEREVRLYTIVVNSLKNLDDYYKETNSTLRVKYDAN